MLFAPVLKKNIVAELKKFFYLPRNKDLLGIKTNRRPASVQAGEASKPKEPRINPDQGVDRRSYGSFLLYDYPAMYVKRVLVRTYDTR